MVSTRKRGGSPASVFCAELWGDWHCCGGNGKVRGRGWFGEKGEDFHRKRVTCEQADRQLEMWDSCRRKSETIVVAMQVRAELEEGRPSHSFNDIWSVPMMSGVSRGAGKGWRAK